LIELCLLTADASVSFERSAAREFASALESQRVAAWLAVDERGFAAGCACVVFWNRLPYAGTSLHAELAGVYVAPEHRNRGYARALAGEALAAARARGARSVFVHPTARSRSLYRALGFTESGQMRL
jgi:GNAT superfamily N-acetyltransferase